MNAAKFLNGYLLGLPIAKFSNNQFTNIVEFYQLQPTNESEDSNKKFFSQTRYSQQQIARSSIVCLSGPGTVNVNTYDSLI